MANMMNSSTSLVSEMIGMDDAACAIVFASFNIIESFSNGGVAYLLTAFKLVESATAMRWILSFVPIICANLHMLPHISDLRKEWYNSMLKQIQI